MVGILSLGDRSNRRPVSMSECQERSVTTKYVCVIRPAGRLMAAGALQVEVTQKTGLPTSQNASRSGSFLAGRRQLKYLSGREKHRGGNRRERARPAYVSNLIGIRSSLDNESRGTIAWREHIWWLRLPQGQHAIHVMDPDGVFSPT